MKSIKLISLLDKLHVEIEKRNNLCLQEPRNKLIICIQKN